MIRLEVDAIGKRGGGPTIQELQEAALRTKRLKIAFALAGPGSAQRFAAELGVSTGYLQHCVSRRPRGDRSGGRKTSWRMEQAADHYIREQFAKHAATLNLGGRP